MIVAAVQIKLWRPLYPENPILETSSKFVLLRVGNAVCSFPRWEQLLRELLIVCHFLVITRSGVCAQLWL
jgi:nicotinic acid mononucleotide adenylyltransferase